VNVLSLHGRAVRLDDPDDVAAVQQLWQTNLEYCRLAGELDPGGALRPDHARRFLHDELTRSGGRVHLYVQDKDPVALTAELVPHPREPHPWIGLLLVDGVRQGVGIGARCVAAVHARLADEGWEEVRLAVLENNPKARRFWERQGYRRLEDRVDADGRRCTLMFRRLPARTS
jgi:GNAT superfamily N-acetyltransferase